MIERIDGANVAMADCEKASRHISVLMDVENPIDSEYNLELSSTGLDRPMTRQKDFANNIGKVVKLSLKAPINGQKRFSGVVKEVTENMISLASVQPAEIIEIDFNNIVEAHLDYFAKNNKKTKKGEK